MTRRSISRAILAGFALAAVAGATPAAHAAVHVNIGVNLPAPPQLVPVPAAPAIEYAPGVNANYFFFDGQYWVFSHGRWYAARGYNGPWVAVAPEYVPRPLLGVPVRYYRRPPTAWRHWQRESAPRWQAHYGRRWEERRHEGQALPRERRDDHRDWRDGHRDDRR